MAPLARVLAFVACAVGCVGAPSAPPRQQLQDALQTLLARPELAGSRIGACVVDGATGRRLVDSSADRGFATASNMKLFSAAVALTTLGAEHRAATELWLRGKVQDGVLRGELVLCGHGDPTFGVAAAGSTAFAAMVEALRANGVQRLVGRIVGDDRWLGSEHLGLGWQWDYLDEDYAAPFGALCCGGNVVTVRVQPGTDGPAVSVFPAVLPAPRSSVRQVAAASDNSVSRPARLPRWPGAWWRRRRRRSRRIHRPRGRVLRRRSHEPLRARRGRRRTARCR